MDRGVIRRRATRARYLNEETLKSRLRAGTATCPYKSLVREARLGWGCVVGKKLLDALRLFSIDDRRQRFEAGAAYLFKASEVSQ